MKRKFLSILLVLCIIVTILPSVPAFANGTFDAQTSLLFSIHMNKNYTAFKVETSANLHYTYGIEINGTKYKAENSAYNGGLYTVELEGKLSPSTTYTAKPYYENGGVTYYAQNFVFTTPAALQSFPHESCTYYKTATGNTAVAYNNTTAGPSGGLDVIGKNGNSWLSSTYRSSGWGVNYSTISGKSYFTEIDGPFAHKVYSDKIQGWTIPEFSDDGYFVKVNYYIRNVSQQTISDYKFGSAADIKIDENDYAPITKTDYGFELSDGTNSFALVLNEGFTDTPVSTAWIGSFDYAGNNVFTNSTSNKLTGTDSGAAYSWQDITLAPGELKHFYIILGVGDTQILNSLLKPNAEVDYIDETLKGLEASESYEITCDGTVYILTSDANGEIALSGTDNNSKPYNFVGKTVSVVEIKDGERSEAQNVTISGRPTPVIPDCNIPGDITPELPDDVDIKTTTTTVTIDAEQNQEYSIDGGVTWKSADSNGDVVFDSLTEGTEYNILTRLKATTSSFASESQSFTIKTLKMLDLSDVTISGNNVIYDGNEKSLTASADGATVSYSTSLNGTYTALCPAYTNVGTYTIYYKIEKDGYHAYYNTAELVISKATVYEVPTDITAIYGKTLADVTLPTGWEWNNSSTSVGNVGTSSFKAKFTPADTANYNIVTDIDVPVTINPKPVAISWNETSFVYNGTEKTVVPTVTNTVGADVVNLTVSGNKATDADSYTATVTALDNNNYTLTGATGAEHIWNIVKSATEFEDIKPYNGTSQTSAFTYGDTITVKVKPRPTGIALMSVPASNQMALYYGETQISDVADADGEGYYTLTFNTTENTLPAGGDVTLTAKYVGNDNMGDYSQNVTITLAKATPDYTIPSGLTAVYTQTLADVTLPAGWEWNDSSTVVGNVGTNSFTAKFTPADTDNYNVVENIYVPVIVSKADAVITVDTTPIEITYGEDVTIPNATTNFGSVTCDKTSADMVIAGSYTITYTVEGTNNYNGTTQTVNVTINPKPVVISWDETSFVYNGTEKTVVPTVSNTVGADVVNLTVSGDRATDVNSYTATVTALDNSNYTLTGATGAEHIWSIVKSATEFEDIKPYNGTSQTSAFTYGDTITVKVKPKATGIALMSVPASNQMALYYGETQISDAADADGEGYYTLTFNTTENTLPAGGDVTLAAKYVGNNNMGDYSQNVTITLAKADSVLGTSPETVSGLVYNKCDYALVTPGADVVGGTLKYKLDDGEYTTEIPEAANAGTYTVYYKVFGDSNHNDTAEQSVVVTIAEKKINPVFDIPAPVAKEEPVTTIETEEYTAVIVWSPAVSEKFAYSTEYIATVTVTPKTNYTVLGVSTYMVEDAVVTSGEIPGEFTAAFEKTQPAPRSTATTTYSVKFNTNGGGSIKNQKILEGGKVTKPHEPSKEGYIFGGWYTDEEFENEFDFSQKVTKSFTLYAKWVEEDAEEEHICPSAEFEDLDVSEWYHLDTDYVLSNGLMKGMAEKEFSPSGKLTRAMLVAILYRLEGEPATNRSIPFADIDMGAYYASAVIWAEQNGIVEGISETEFAPDNHITREQIATIMFRYAVFKGMNAVTMEENLHFDDSNEISEYAITAMNWAVGTELLKGRTESTINPKDTAMRSEIAAILHRFIEE